MRPFRCGLVFMFCLMLVQNAFAQMPPAQTRDEWTGYYSAIWEVRIARQYGLYHWLEYPNDPLVNTSLFQNGMVSRFVVTALDTGSRANLASSHARIELIEWRKSCIATCTYSTNQSQTFGAYPSAVPGKTNAQHMDDIYSTTGAALIEADLQTVFNDEESDYMVKWAEAEAMETELDAYQEESLEWRANLMSWPDDPQYDAALVIYKDYVDEQMEDWRVKLNDYEAKLHELHDHTIHIETLDLKEWLFEPSELDTDSWISALETTYNMITAVYWIADPNYTWQ